ncbi:MAG: XdhC family protein [Acidimicrobiales bacterium]
MREIIPGLRMLADRGAPFGLAMTVGVRGSSPRPPGAMMAVDVDGTVVGSLSGGCVEGAVYAACAEAIETGVPVVETYGISDEDAFAVGLTCGGVLEVLVRRVDGPSMVMLGSLVDSLEREEPVALATVVRGPGRVGSMLVVHESRMAGALGDAELDRAVSEDAREMLAHGQIATRRYGIHGERWSDEIAVFVQAFPPPPRMLVFGAVDFAAAVVRLGAFLGFRVTVCDARAPFATEARFPEADEVVCAWPHDYLEQARVDQRTVICVLTHDPKFDIPLLEVALRSPAGYIGAMGSRRTHEQRVASLRERGLTDEELVRLRAPIGLDIGARTPEETAVSISAEIIQARWGGSGLPLSTLTGPIHAYSTGAGCDADLSSTMPARQRP